jgi:hypothetical protein
MRISELEVSEFFRIMREELGLNQYLSYTDACTQYNISKDHLQYQVRSGHLKSIHKHGKAYVLKCEMDRLLQCNMLIHKRKE